jgi:oligopeptide transport system substrate-binding protein
MIRLLLIPLVMAALVCGAVIWSGAHGGEQRADFSFINRGDNKSLDINDMSWMQDIRLAYALWEGLYTLDPLTLKPVLGCADSAQVDPQTHRVWTIHIRPDARWSNGDPVLAKDFLFSWRRFLETPGEYTYLHYYIKGAKEYSDAFAAYGAARAAGNADAAPPDISSVGEEALDERTLRVTLVDPIPFFPALCAFTPFYPMNEASMADFREVDPITGVVNYNKAFTRPPHLVTDGPYYLAEWQFKRRLRMVANPYYWNRSSLKNHTVDQIYDEDPLAEFRAYDRGDVNWLADFDPNLAAGVLAAGGRSDLHVFKAFGTYYYSFNCMPKLPGGRPNPLRDVRVRQALAMSIEKERIVREVGRLNQPVTNDLIPPGIFEDYKSPPGLPYDVAKARELLAEAGYPNGAGFPRLKILYNTEGPHGDIAQIIRRDWLNNLGIETELSGVEVKVFGKWLNTQQYDIARSSWYGDYDDPSTFTDMYKTDSEENNAKWSNAKYDALCAAAQSEQDPHRRFGLLSQAENILLNEAPIVPLYTYVGVYMFRQNVTGIPLNPHEYLMFQGVAVEH